jgi:hypothetical protein
MHIAHMRAPRATRHVLSMQVMGQKIAQLEMRKKAAVEKEDYDTAKVRCSGW